MHRIPPGGFKTNEDNCFLTVQALAVALTFMLKCLHMRCLMELHINWNDTTNSFTGWEPYAYIYDNQIQNPIILMVIHMLGTWFQSEVVKQPLRSKDDERQLWEEACVFTVSDWPCSKIGFLPIGKILFQKKHYCLLTLPARAAFRDFRGRASFGHIYLAPVVSFQLWRNWKGLKRLRRHSLISFAAETKEPGCMR